MKSRREIFLSKETISKKRWFEFLLCINQYHSIFSTWHLEICFLENSIHFFIETNVSLPPIITGFEEFLFQNTKTEEKEKKKRKLPIYLGTGKSSFEIYDFFLLKKKRQLYKIKLSIIPLWNRKFYTSIFLVFHKRNTIYQQRLLLTTASSTLSVPLQTKRRFFLQPIPKYFNLQKSIHLFHKKANFSILQVQPFPYSSTDLFF